MGAEGSRGPEVDSEARPVSKHPIVEQDGHKFYAIPRYTKKGSYTDYVPVDGPYEGHGTGVSLANPQHRALAKLGRQSAMELKSQRAQAYEERVYAELENVANLQSRIVELANDEGADLDKQQMEKLRLGLQAGEAILNRALGKAVTKVDMDVKHSHADQIAEIEAEWVEEIE
jgi:hypothetical protein